jgi:hypothetical protein
VLTYRLTITSYKPECGRRAGRRAHYIQRPRLCDRHM